MLFILLFGHIFPMLLNILLRFNLNNIKFHSLSIFIKHFTVYYVSHPNLLC
jgi:hypothetical protein